jgi:predicted porin
MNKKLLAMAIATAVSIPAIAQADVKVYGIAQVEYNVEDDDGAGQDSVQSVDDNAGRSRLGFKFKEKLGGGLTAFGKIEFRLDPADTNSQGTNGTTAGSNGSLGARDQFVGIKGSWGSLAAGSFHAPYKTAGGVKWDPWAATHLQARRAGGMTGGAGIGGHNGFMRNTLYYTSPNINGFQAKLALAPDETNPGAENGNDGDNDWSLALSYKNGPWHAIFAYNNNNNPSGQDDEDLLKVGLRWKQGNHTLAGQYENIDDADRSATGSTPGLGNNYRVCSGCDADVYWLNYQFKSGNNIFTVSYGNTDVDQPGGPDYDHDYWAAGIIHKFSKKTRIFGGYTQTDGDNDSPNGGGQDDRDAWTIGIRKDF